MPAARSLPPRPSIFDALAEKYPHLESPAPIRRRRYLGRLGAIVILLAAGFAAVRLLNPAPGLPSPEDRALAPHSPLPEGTAAEKTLLAKTPRFEDEEPRPLPPEPAPPPRQPAKIPPAPPSAPTWAKVIRPQPGVAPAARQELPEPHPPTPEPATPERPTHPVVGLEPDITPPVRLFAPVPRYPPSAWVAALQGDVKARATIDKDGRVAAVEILEGLSPELDAATVEALESWRFRPARRGGSPIAVDHILTFRFAR